MEKLPLRSEIDSKLKWKLEDMYENDEVWEADFAKISQEFPRLTEYKGRIAESAATLLEFYRLEEEISLVLEKLYVYARMRKDEDNSKALYQEMTGRVEMLMMQIQASLAFFEPELLKAGKSKLEAYMEQEPELKAHDFSFQEMFRQKKHVLSEKEERLLALAQDCAGTGDEAFTMFNNADIKFPIIKDEKGNDTELTKGRYSSFMESRDRTVRENAFKALYKTYGDYKNTVAACYGGSIKADIFYSQARKFNSSLEASLSSDKVPVKVYDNLIKVIHKNIPMLTKYLKLRKKMLGVSELHMYDLYVPIVSVPERKYSYEEARQLVLEALAPLGEDYCKVIQEAYDSGWIDVCENVGKTSGAYSWGCYASHPYVLLNWQGTINDVFTLAHELGHAMHTYYSNKTQPYAKASYRIFVAEVASTVNENLLFHYLLNKTEDKMERAYLLNHYLEEFRGTMFRQVMFAEFEKLAHEIIPGGGAVTADTLGQLYYKLNQEFFGAAVTVDEEIALEWARIPHFYTSFYVYKYATGFSAAVALADGILSWDSSRISAYRHFLTTGGSDYPLELLKNAGVDLTKTAPVQSALNVFGKNLKLLEKEIKG